MVKKLAVAARLREMDRPCGGPLPSAKLAQELLMSRFADAYPGRRRLKGFTHPEGTPEVRFIDGHADAGGFGYGRMGRRRKEPGSNQIFQEYHLSLILYVDREAARTILTAGILTGGHACTVWAREITPPACFAGTRAFEAVWVVAGRGMSVRRCEGLLIKRANGQITRYEGECVEAALTARSVKAETEGRKRAARPKPFKFKKPRYTLADRLCRLDETTASLELLPRPDALGFRF